MKNQVKAIGLMVGLLLLACGQDQLQTVNQNVIEEGTSFSAPSFDLPDLSGTSHNLSDYEGSYVVVHIATTWCPFCNAEAPYLEKLQQDYQSRNVEVMIIDVMEPKELVKKKLSDRFDLTFPVLLDADGAVAASFAPKDVLPDLERYEVMLASNLIIDPMGRVRYMSLLNTEKFDARLIDLRSQLDALLDDSSLSFLDDEFTLEDSEKVVLGRGEQGYMSANFRIPRGFHIQANDPDDEYLIATEFNVQPVPGLIIGDPVFPPFQLYTYSGSDEKYRVFFDPVEIKVPVRSEATSTGDYSVKASISFQACNDRKCFLPRTQHINIPISII